MMRAIFIVIFCLASSTSYARGGYGFFCLNLADQVSGPKANSETTLAVTITKSGKIHIYNAPNLYCQMTNVPVVEGEALTVYKSYDGWVNVKYIDKNGNDHVGWIPENMVNEIAISLRP
jgi:hypothetical protein